MPSSRASAFPSRSSPLNSSSSAFASRLDEENDEWKTCRCPARSPLLIAWTVENAGRRFWSCPNFRGGGCNFFLWKDVEPFPSQARSALRILLEENQALKQRVSVLEGKMKGKVSDEGDKEMLLLKRECALMGKEMMLSNREENVRRREVNLKRRFMFFFMCVLIVVIGVYVSFNV